ERKGSEPAVVSRSARCRLARLLRDLGGGGLSGEPAPIPGEAEEGLMNLYVQYHNVAKEGLRLSSPSVPCVQFGSSARARASRMLQRTTAQMSSKGKGIHNNWLSRKGSVSIRTPNRAIISQHPITNRQMMRRSAAFAQTRRPLQVANTPPSAPRRATISPHVTSFIDRLSAGSKAGVPPTGRQASCPSWRPFGVGRAVSASVAHLPRVPHLQLDDAPELAPRRLPDHHQLALHEDRRQHA